MNWIKPDWPAADNIHSAITLRTGGVSQRGYSSLNLAQHVNDDPHHVLENRKIISRKLNLPAKPAWLQQIHSNLIVKADQINQQVQADGSYTEQAGIVCVVLTADCLPLLLASKDGAKVAAVHGGWRGLLSGVINNAVSAMGTNQLYAFLGPAIGPNSFEVGGEVRNQFVNKSSAYDKAFRQINPEKFLADIYQLARIELAMLGINSVYGGNYCTMTEKRFYSYRREGETGRMATLIWRD